jgi:hypothetical protein
MKCSQETNSWDERAEPEVNVIAGSPWKFLWERRGRLKNHRWPDLILVTSSGQRPANRECRKPVKRLSKGIYHNSPHQVAVFGRRNTKTVTNDYDPDATA